MRSAAAVLIAVSSGAWAHPGHGAAEGHFHGWGLEHGLLLALVLVLLAYATRAK